MRHLKLGIPLICTIAAFLGLSGCADESHWGNSSNQKGSISLKLSTDSGIKSAKPVFRSEDTENTKDLSNYMSVPSPEDFSIQLERSTGEVSSWSTLTDFKEYIANNSFNTGTYTLTAYYGEKGKQDFEAPYFEASTTFNVLSDQDNEINLTAELQNSLIIIEYSENFKNFMKDYHAKIRTEGIGEPITYGNLETRPLFIEPKNASLSLHFTTKGKEYTSDIVVGDFPPIAKTLHKITFDLKGEPEIGDATIEVEFDESLEEDPISIDLTEELHTKPAPVITCEGFENGQTLDMLDAPENIGEIKMIATTSDKIASAKLTIESTNYQPSWGNEIDLCKATTEQQNAISIAGIEAIGFGFDGKQTDMYASLDLTKFGKNLVSKKGNHKVTLVVTDAKGKTSESTSVVFDSQEISLGLIGSPSFAYAAETGELTFDYNGNNPIETIHFNVEGQRVITKNCIEQTSTRASEKKTYIITLPLNNPIKKSIQIVASYKGEKKLGEFTIPVNIPEYEIEAFDAFSRYAYAKISTPGSDNSVLSAVTNNIKLKDLNIVNRDPSSGIITITGLSEATTYSVISSITGDTPSDNMGSFTTETELPVPNGDFEDLSQTINATINQGGLWTITAAGKTHQTTLSMSIKEPQGWVSSNALTCNLNSSNKNSWYVIPSVYNTTLSWISHQPDAKAVGFGQSAYDSTAEIYKKHNSKSNSNAMVIRNVAWDSTGISIADNKQTGNADHSNYYCSNHPTSIANRTAGYLYLGSASKEGADFTSRPVKLKGFYMYENDTQDKNEKGKVSVEILNGNDIIGSGQLELGAANDYSEFEIPIEYISEMFLPKATTLKIYITSSNKTADIKTTDYCNKDECCSRGATLIVDNLTFEY